MTLEELELREEAFAIIRSIRQLTPAEARDYLWMKREERRVIASLQRGLDRVAERQRVRKTKALRSQIKRQRRVEIRCQA